MKASITNSRHTPRKMRLVADLIKGKKVDEALSILSLAPKRAASTLLKLLKSAVANAKNQGVSVENLIIEKCSVDKGIVFKRFMPVARGSAHPILKRTSHIDLVLGVKGQANKESGSENKVKSKKLTS